MKHALGHCNICGVKLNQPDKRETEDCGGDCLKCMAQAGDPDCIRAMKKLGKRINED